MLRRKFVVLVAFDGLCNGVGAICIGCSSFLEDRLDDVFGSGLFVLYHSSCRQLFRWRVLYDHKMGLRYVLRLLSPPGRWQTTTCATAIFPALRVGFIGLRAILSSHPIFFKVIALHHN